MNRPTAYSPYPPPPINPGMFDSHTHMACSVAVWIPLAIIWALLLPVLIVAYLAAVMFRWVR